jgi:phospholipid transport system substrate-binding protein
MHPIRRLALVVLAFATGVAFRPAACSQDAAPSGTARALCDALLSAMKRGPALDFAARRDLLAPEIGRDLDVPLMTRLIVGPSWRNFAPSDRQQLVDAFSAYSVATYAERFKSYAGERFDVDPVPVKLPSGDCIVHTRLFTGDPDPVQLDYLMRSRDGRWRIIDVYLSGTISELAARRSEYSAVLREGGAPALVALLLKKADELGR